MFENLGHFFKKIVKEPQKELGSKDAAKERLHLVLMQDRANVSADFLELMKQEIIDVIKKYIVVDEESIDVRLTNQENDDGTNGAPALFANIPIVNIKNDMMAEKIKEFEGVDFNKEMGLTKYDVEDQESEEKKETPSVIQLPESSSKIEENKAEKQDAKQEESSVEAEEVKELFEEVDDAEDDDDDVTFDDLLKAAEAADKKNEQTQEQKNPEKNQQNKNQSSNSQQKNNSSKQSKDKVNKKK